MGDLTGDVLGTYNPDTGTWEAVSLGTWEGEPLAFVSEVYPYLYHAAQYYNGK